VVLRDLPIGIFYVPIGAVSQQDLNHIDVIVHDGEVKRGVAPVIHGINHCGTVFKWW